MRFARATTVTGTGPGVYTGTIEPGWDIFGVTNGGFLLAVAARAMTEETGGRRLVGINGRFVNPARPGRVTVEVEMLKEGRSLSTVRGLIRDDERTLATVNASMGSEEAGDGRHLLNHGEPPELPPPEECVRLQPGSPVPPQFTADTDIRLHPDDVVGSDPGPGPAGIRGWFRLLDDEPLDPIGLVFVVDAFPPAIFNSGLPIGWTPTIDLNVQIRRPGPHDWVACSFTTRQVTGSLLEEDGEVWDTEGNLVAISRQLALVPSG
ncbi:MAG: thioesterase family protein [Actinobacteria bacterium]|nr:thioesterase family protein [Actinomycetota bacterium]